MTATLALLAATLLLPAQSVRMAQRVSEYSAPTGAPYSAEEVTVPTAAGHALAGTLTLPKGASREKPVPAVVTATGGGPQDRDGFVGIEGYRPFRQLADSLSRRGIAVLRMDDRGVGGSTGVHGGATTADFADDMRAGLAFLRTRPEVDARRLGLLGHSEGGVIASIVALSDPNVRAIVILASPAMRGRPLLEYQMRNLAMKDSRLTLVQRDSAIARIPAEIDSMVAADPWLAYYFQYDPIATARRLNNVSVLILNGSTDQQVTSDQLRELAAAFVAGGNRDVSARVFGNLNHMFVYDPDGFSLPQRNVEPEVVGVVVDWLIARLR